MAHESSKVTGFAVDNTTGTLTNISGSTNSVDPGKTFEQLDDTGLGDSMKSYIDGLGDAPTIAANGYLNSTTRAIFQPLVFTATSVSNVKTVELKMAAGDFWSGEATVESVQLSTGVGSINTWSANFRPTASLTSTSVTGVS